MSQIDNRIVQVLAVDARCSECGWVSQPVVLVYSRITHSNGLWCQECFAREIEAGTFSSGQEGRS